jgi:hypothetical protein
VIAAGSVPNVGATAQASSATAEQTSHERGQPAPVEHVPEGDDEQDAQGVAELGGGDQPPGRGVGDMQVAAGRDPHDRGLTELVGELSTCSEEFRVLWARHDVRAQARGVKRMNHPVVGRLDLHYEVMHLAAEQGLTFVAYTAEPGTASHDALSLLATWTATQDRDPEPSSPVTRVAGPHPQR